jgi:hypothetical protein
MHQGFMWLSSGNIHREGGRPSSPFPYYSYIWCRPAWASYHDNTVSVETEPDGSYTSARDRGARYSPQGRSPRNTLLRRLSTSRIPSLCSGKGQICSYVPEGNWILVATHFFGWVIPAQRLNQKICMHIYVCIYLLFYTLVTSLHLLADFCIITIPQN